MVGLVYAESWNPSKRTKNLNSITKPKRPRPPRRCKNQLPPLPPKPANSSITSIKFQPVPNTTSKAISQAIALIAQHGTELAHYIVDFAHREAGKTNYQPQTFGGIFQYEPRAITEHTNENARRKAQQAVTTCTLCDRNGYATFANEQGSGGSFDALTISIKSITSKPARNYRHVLVSV